MAEEAETLTSQYSFQLRPHSTYSITGGLEALGLEEAVSFAYKGAKRLVPISLQPLQRCCQSTLQKGDLTTQYILSLKAIGVSVDVTSLDINLLTTSANLLSALEAPNSPSTWCNPRSGDVS